MYGVRLAGLSMVFSFGVGFTSMTSISRPCSMIPWKIARAFWTLRLLNCFFRTVPSAWCSVIHERYCLTFRKRARDG